MAVRPIVEDKKATALSRGLRWAFRHPALSLALLLTTGLAAAAITVTYSTSSTLTTSVTAPPIQLLDGTDAGESALSDYVTAYDISTNRTYLTATVKGVPEANLTVGSFFRLQNADDASHAVTLSTSQVSNSYVGTYALGIYDGSSALVATMDLKAASPSATFTLPAGATYSARLWLVLNTGAGADNVDVSSAVALSFA